MKNIIILFILTFTLSCCNKDDAPKPIILPVQLLPPATQTGANTFGCLLDGQVFLPGNGSNPLDCVYQNIGGDYFFTLQANKRDSNSVLIGLALTTQRRQLLQNNIYSLIDINDGNVSGNYSFGTLYFNTNQTETGQLTITKLDLTNQIVSGTFWYDVKDANGVVHQIREGRFDMRYTM
jgi:hypothetical protein